MRLCALTADRYLDEETRSSPTRRGFFLERRDRQIGWVAAIRVNYKEFGMPNPGCVFRLIMDRVSRATWTLIPAAREQNSGVIVDTIRGAPE
jgi:hypothetical protein